MKNTNIYNLLIVEDNIIQSHEMANYISEKFENVKIYSMAATGKEAINIINKNIVDIILLDLLLPDMLGNEILDHITSMQNHWYEQSIIIVTGMTELLTKIINNNNVFDYIIKPSNSERLYKSIKKLLELKGDKEKEEEKKIRIYNELRKIHYDFIYI